MYLSLRYKLFEVSSGVNSRLQLLNHTGKYYVVCSWAVVCDNVPAPRARFLPLLFGFVITSRYYDGLKIGHVRSADFTGEVEAALLLTEIEVVVHI